MFFNKCPHTPDIVGQSFNYGQERERERGPRGERGIVEPTL